MNIPTPTEPDYRSVLRNKKNLLFKILLLDFLLTNISYIMDYLKSCSLIQPDILLHNNSVNKKTIQLNHSQL